MICQCTPCILLEKIFNLPDLSDLITGIISSTTLWTDRLSSPSSKNKSFIQRKDLICRLKILFLKCFIKIYWSKRVEIARYMLYKKKCFKATQIYTEKLFFRQKKNGSSSYLEYQWECWCQSYHYGLSQH